MPRRVNSFVSRDHRDTVPGRRGDDFLSQQGPTAAFDHLKLRIDFVGAVEVDIQCVDVVELDESQCGGCKASSAVATLVATATNFSPSSLTLSPSRRTIRAAVDPDPSPTAISL